MQQIHEKSDTEKQAWLTVTIKPRTFWLWLLPEKQKIQLVITEELVLPETSMKFYAPEIFHNQPKPLTGRKEQKTVGYVYFLG